MIINRFNNFWGSPKFQDIEELILLCQNYLKTHDDLPIQQYLDMITIFKIVRTEGIYSDNELLTQTVEKLWQQLEKHDIWYANNICVLNTILFRFHLESLPELTDLIFKRLDKYADFKDIKPLKLAIFINLSTIFLKNHKYQECLKLLDNIEELARTIKRYDSLALVHVRRGICTQQPQLIQKGLDILTLIEEEELLANCQEEIKLYSSN